MRLKMRNHTHFRRQIEQFDQAFEVVSSHRPSALGHPNALQGVSGQSCLLGWCQENLGEGQVRLCAGLSQWFSPFRQCFKAPCAVQRAPCSSLMPPKVGPSLSILPPSISSSNITIGPGAEPHLFPACHRHPLSNCAANALNQAYIPARRMMHCPPPRGTRPSSLRKGRRTTCLPFGDTPIRAEWKDLLHDGVQTGHLCVSIYG